MNIQQSVYRQTGLIIPEGTPLGNPLKSAIQEATLTCPENILVFEWATAVSKTRGALLHCQGISMLNVCKQITHFETWTKEMEKWNLHPSSYVQTTYNSLRKYVGMSFDIIVVDEAQRLTETSFNELKQINFKKIIFCSATIPDEVHARIRQLGKPRIINIPDYKGIEWKLIPVPKITVIDFPLDNTNRYLRYQRHQKRFPPGITTIHFNDWNQYKFKFMNLDVICTQYEYYQLLEDEFISAREAFFKQPDCRMKPNLMSQQTQFFYNNFLQKGGMRKKFLGTIRTQIVQTLIDKFKNDRLVVFANSTEQCNLFANGLPVVHSKSKDKHVIQMFNEGKINQLHCINMADESINLEGKFKAIHVNMTGSKIKSTQRRGRAARHVDSETFVFYSRNTVDDGYFIKFKGQLKDEYFTFLTLKDIYETSNQ